MSEQLRFARTGPNDSASALAALSVVRALVHHLVATGRLQPEEIERIRDEALGDLPEGSDWPAVRDARELVTEEFP